MFDDTHAKNEALGTAAEVLAGTDPDEDADLDTLPEPPAGLTEQDYHGCRWIEGELAPLRAGLFCGRPVLRGSSWCPHHFRTAFGKRSARPRLRKHST